MQTLKLIDIGLNLTNKRFEKDLDTVLANGRAAGVEHIIITGTSLNESRRALELARLYPGIAYATAGIHPHDADQAGEDFVNQLEQLALQPEVKAIGECGLDFNRNFSTPANQQQVFDQQLALAAKLTMPVFLHQRDAFNRWQEILQPHLNQIPAAVSHCFTGDLQQLRRCLDMGLYIGITGWICDPKRGQELFEIARYIPLDRIMIESDAPYLLPKNIRPKPKSSRNEPRFLPAVLCQLAKAMKIEEQKLARHCWQNSLSFFNIAL
jgi:TatD DNase family protein